MKLQSIIFLFMILIGGCLPVPPDNGLVSDDTTLNSTPSYGYVSAVVQYLGGSSLNGSTIESVQISGDNIIEYKILIANVGSCSSVDFSSTPALPISYRYDFVPSGNGTFVACVIGSDSYGNWQIVPSSSSSFLIDTAEPEIYLRSNLNGYLSNDLGERSVEYGANEVVTVYKIKSYKFTSSAVASCSWNTPDGAISITSDLSSLPGQVSGSYSFTPSDGDGFYIVCAIAIDTVGNLQDVPKASYVLEIDTTPPVVGIDDSGLGTSPSRSLYERSVMFSGAVKYKVAHAVGNSCSGTNLSVAVETTNSTYTFTPEMDKSYVVCGIGQDSADNWSTSVTASRILLLDATAPLISLSIDGATLAPTNNISQRTVSLSGGYSYKVMHFKSSNCLLEDLSSVEESTSSIYYFTPALEGEYVVCAIGRDQAGNWTTENDSTDILTIDLTAPAITMDDSSMSPSPSIDQNDRAISLSGADVYKFKVLRDETCSSINFDNILSVIDPDFNFSISADGEYVVCAIGRDQAGNWSDMISSSILIIDLEGPEMIITADVSQSGLTISGEINTSSVNLEEYKLAVVFGTSVCPEDVNDAAWGASFYTDVVPVPYLYTTTTVETAIEGAYKLCVKGKNNLGNWGDTTTSNRIMLTHPANLSFTATTGADGLITATLDSTNSDISQVTLQLTEETKDCSTAMTLATGSSVPFTHSTLFEMPTGTYKLCGSATSNTGVARSVETTVTVDNIYNDPLYTHQWHLHNTGQNAFSTSSGRAGISHNVKPVIKAGFDGDGILIAIVDHAVQNSHSELSRYSVIGSRDYTDSNNDGTCDNGDCSSDDYPVVQLSYGHGTAVAGILLAKGNNGIGGAGIASGASYASRSIFGFFGIDSFADSLTSGGGYVDIISRSIGSPGQCSYKMDIPLLLSTLQNEVSTNDTMFVKSAGNSYADYFTADCITNAKQFRYSAGGVTEQYYVGNANMEQENHNSYDMIVGAFSATGERAPYSSVGANLWISGAGGHEGVLTDGRRSGTDMPAIITTDLTGCTDGFSTSYSTGDFDKGDSVFSYGGALANGSCDYTNSMNGTSAAAPSISGIIALLLQVNPSLTWREVRYILAKTADTSFAPVDSTHPFEDILASGIFDDDVTLTSTVLPGHTYSIGWLTNSAGFSFSNWYGFGRADAAAAVTLADALDITMGTYTSIEPLERVGDITIPDYNYVGGSDNIYLSQSNFFIESVELTVSITHPYIGDLGIELTSPSGIVSQLTYINSGVAGIDYTDAIFVTNAFFGEDVTGQWTIKVIDGAVGDAGEITKWKVLYRGHYK